MRPSGEVNINVGSADAVDRVGVLVVDDQLVFRQAAREVIEATEPFELLGYASSGNHALAAVGELEPDLVLLDVRMPGMSGIETARLLKTSAVDPVVILISIEERPNLPAGIESSGAAALVRKQDFGPALLRRLWLAHGRGSA
ncbi:MAG: response regulator transcription factor [Thermoleophilaceae bacterium]